MLEGMDPGDAGTGPDHCIGTAVRAAYGEPGQAAAVGGLWLGPLNGGVLEACVGDPAPSGMAGVVFPEGQLGLAIPDEGGISGDPTNVEAPCTDISPSQSPLKPLRLGVGSLPSALGDDGVSMPVAPL